MAVRFMSDASLLQTFRTEIAGNPRKTLILAILLLVGLSIWIPQIGRLTNRSQYALPAAPVTPPAAETAGTSSPSTSASDSLRSSSLGTWQELVAGIEGEDSLKPVAPQADLVNPFRGGKEKEQSAVEIVPVIDPQPPVTAPVPASLPPKKEILPAPADLVLKSTLQGKKSRGAVINDRFYREGETVEMDQASYLVSRVEARRVILKRDEQLYELLIPSVLPRSTSPLPSPSTSPPETSL